MFRFVVVDMPQVGALFLAVVFVVLMYFIYCDVRMLIQMVVDLKEEWTIGRMTSPLTKSSDKRSSSSVASQASSVGEATAIEHDDGVLSDDREAVESRNRGPIDAEETPDARED